MTRGTRVGHAKNPGHGMLAVKNYAALSNLSNSNPVIDYRPGLSFSSMLASSQAPPLPLGSEYKVNLDNNGHTVNMNIQPAPSMLAALDLGVKALGTANAGVFLTNEQIATVASRIANELCGKRAAAVTTTATASARALAPERAPERAPRRSAERLLERGAERSTGHPAAPPARLDAVDEAVPTHISRQLHVMQRRIDSLQSQLCFGASPATSAPQERG